MSKNVIMAVVLAAMATGCAGRQKSTAFSADEAEDILSEENLVLDPIPRGELSKERHFRLEFPEIPGWSADGSSGPTTFLVEENSRAIIDITVYPMSEVGSASRVATIDHGDISAFPNTKTTEIVKKPNDGLEFSYRSIADGETVMGKMFYRDFPEFNVVLTILGKWYPASSLKIWNDFDALTAGTEILTDDPIPGPPPPIILPQ